jgi:hypothetical protein
MTHPSAPVMLAILTARSERLPGGWGSHRAGPVSRSSTLDQPELAAIRDEDVTVTFVATRER